jgi:hypothetical protein
MEIGQPYSNPEPDRLALRDDLAQKRAATRIVARRRHISRAYGIFAIIEGALGLLLAVGVMIWVPEETAKRYDMYGQAQYSPVPDTENIGLMLVGAVCFLTVIAGIGFLKRERWAVYCTHICGILIFAISTTTILVRHHLLRGIDPRIPLNIPNLALKLAIAFVISLPLIIPPLLPSIFNSTESRRRSHYSRPHVG